MKISKSGTDYKIKMNEEEYNTMKFLFFDFVLGYDDFEDETMENFHFNNSVIVDEVFNMARVLKGAK